MERERHHNDKYGNGPYHHHYQAGAYNKHAGDHRNHKGRVNVKNLNSLPKRNHDACCFSGAMTESAHDLLDNFLADTYSFQSLDLTANFPSMSVSEDENTITIKAELPAMDEHDIKINTTENCITISGEKKDEIEENRKDYHLSELRYGQFSRSLELPFTIETDKTKASFKKSVLTITIQKPQTEVSKTKTIPITL